MNGANRIISRLAAGRLASVKFVPFFVNLRGKNNHKGRRDFHREPQSSYCTNIIWRPFDRVDF
jgi:hypothetical protein